MKFEDYLGLARNSLSHRGLRSWLTVLGIVIGIAAVFSLISIGQGFDKSVKDQLSSLGGNIIFISPGGQPSRGASFGFSANFGGRGAEDGQLTKNDISALKGVKGLEFVDGMVADRGDVTFRDETITVNVQGFTADIIREFPIIKVDEGRLFSSGESKVAMVGHSVANDLFDREMKIGDIIEIEGETFRVIGILEQGSGATSSIFDQAISVPRSDAERLFLPAGSNQVSAIISKVSEGADIDRATEDVERRLRASHNKVEGEEDFTVGSSKTIQNSVGQISAAITIFLGGIAGISLLVGAIGIVNTMFMSVMERTKQIGILKAIGAKSREVMLVFLVESSLLGLVGGAIGVAIGIGFAMIIPVFSANSGFSGFTPIVSVELASFCIGFSAIVGALSGLLPARRAAKMDPVEALRYE